MNGMISDSIYEHLKGISQSKIGSFLGPVAIIEPESTVSDAINEISKSDSYDIFCMENGSVLTTNVRSLLEGKDISDMKIRHFLSPIQGLSSDDTVQKAANIINNYRVRTVPVVKNNEIVGAITAKNILEQLVKKDNKWIKANLIFTQNPITITSSETLSAARKTMVSKRIDHLPVLTKGVIKQVLTSYHILQALNPHENLGRRARGLKKIRNLESNIGNIGSTRIPQCSPNDSLNKILRMMLDTDTTCCLVILWDNLQGIITYRDILSLLAVKFESEIPLYVVGMPEDLRNVNLITSKFVKALKRIRNVYSEIQEAKVSIKQQRSGSKNRRGGKYEVSVMITTPHFAPFIFKEAGFDLSKIFEILSQKMLRKLSKRAKRRYKTSIRKIETPGLIEPI